MLGLNRCQCRRDEESRAALFGARFVYFFAAKTCSRSAHLITQPVCAEVLEASVRRLNERDLSPSRPTFKLLFLSDCFVSTIEFFNVDQAVNFVFTGEARQQPVTMLLNPPANIVAHPDVNCARAACLYVNVKCPRLNPHFGQITPPKDWRRGILRLDLAFARPAQDDGVSFGQPAELEGRSRVSVALMNPS
jgi:hypothetical protein